jgi:hypothetical protein
MSCMRWRSHHTTSHCITPAHLQLLLGRAQQRAQLRQLALLGLARGLDRHATHTSSHGSARDTRARASNVFLQGQAILCDHSDESECGRQECSRVGWLRVAHPAACQRRLRLRQLAAQLLVRLGGGGGGEERQQQRCAVNVDGGPNGTAGLSELQPNRSAEGRLPMTRPPKSTSRKQPSSRPALPHSTRGCAQDHSMLTMGATAHGPTLAPSSAALAAPLSCASSTA